MFTSIVINKSQITFYLLIPTFHNYVFQQFRDHHFPYQYQLVTLANLRSVGA